MSAFVIGNRARYPIVGSGTTTRNLGDLLYQNKLVLGCLAQQVELGKEEVFVVIYA